MVLRKPQGKGKEGVFAHLNFDLPATDQKLVKLKTRQHCDQNVKKSNHKNTFLASDAERVIATNFCTKNWELWDRTL